MWHLNLTAERGELEKRMWFPKDSSQIISTNQSIFKSPNNRRGKNKQTNKQKRAAQHALPLATPNPLPFAILKSKASRRLHSIQNI